MDTQHVCNRCGSSVAPDQITCDRCLTSGPGLQIPWKIVIPVLLFLGLAAAIIPILVSRGKRIQREKNAAADLAELVQGEEKFKARTGQYWTGDVAGLFLYTESTSTQISLEWRQIETERFRFISHALALADQAPLKKGELPPYYLEPIHVTGQQHASGSYWFRAIPVDGGFGFAALPELEGHRVLLTDHSGKVLAREFDGAVLQSGSTPPSLTGAFDGTWPSDAWPPLD